jgi:hypothetical protein
MRRSNFAAVTIALLLASCGAAPDLPDNVPLAGNWSDTMALVSVSSDGAAMSEDDLPPDFPKPSTKNTCGEPKLRTNEEFREVLDADEILKNCAVGDIRRNGDRVAVSGSCKLPDNNGVAMEMWLDVNAVEAPESIIIDLKTNTIATAEDGEMASFEIKYRRELKRIGDC